MTKVASNFQRDSVISYNRKHRQTLHHNILKHDEAVSRGKERYIRFDQAREYASEIKGEVLSRLPDYLLEFEKNISGRGVKVLWARDANDAILYTRDILKEAGARMVVKSKSMISEEVRFNETVEEWGIEPVETDLGEFIVQTAGEKPYHILTPAMHKLKEDVASLFHDKFDTPPDASPAELTAFVRNRLRPLFTSADAGITGANFLIADIGAISLTENEGNGLMSMSFPKIHIVLAGIERIIPSVSQLPFFWQWLGVHGTGQHISAYNTLITGPRTINETDGPEKMYVILMDNGRSTLLIEPEESAALKCIRCGSCLNACPVYESIGGYAYASTYTGPIGSVITPFYSGFKDFGHLSYASTLCGKCTQVCPVKIPLHELLLLNRQRMVEKYESPVIWNAGMKTFGFVFRKRKRLNLFSGRIKNRMLKMAGHPFGIMKESPRFSGRSFNEEWKISNK